MRQFVKRPTLIFKQVFFLCLALIVHIIAVAQQPGARHKIALFTPLYLDDAFDAVGGYRYSGKSFPKNSIPGLEFYHGASLAIDSLNALGLPLDVYVYDSRSASQSLEQQFSKCAADGVELVIVNGSLTDITRLAKLGIDKKITVVNATVPNDGNVTNNPYFVVLNPTLPTQIEELYNYIKTHYVNQPVTVITRKTNTDNFIRTVLEKYNAHNQNALHLKFTEINDDIALKALTGTGLLIIASLDTDFGSRVLKQLTGTGATGLTVFGMPTWENINLTKADYKGIEIIYGSPFYNPKTDAASKNISSYYSKKMYARPSDLVYRGYALAYRFGRLLNLYGRDINNNLSARDYRVFFDFNIKPVYNAGKLSYYENKKLYFLKYVNGGLKSVN